MKILPVALPEITAYPHHAHLYSILNGIDKRDQYKLPWICNNYVQLEYESNHLDFSNGFDILPLLENCPWLVKDSISYEMIKLKWENIIEFIIDSINMNYYVYLEVDEYFIREYDNYKQRHLSHTMLVYGYDESNKEFLIADFFKNRKYYFSKTSFEDLRDAYENIPTTFLLGVFLFREKESAFFSYHYDRIALVKNLEDYLYSRNTKERNMIINYPRIMPHVKESTFGLNVFDAIYNDFWIEGNLSLPNAYVIKEHIKVLEMIVLRLVRMGLLQDWEDIYFLMQGIRDASEIYVRLVIKYNAARSDKLKKRILNRLVELKNAEELVIGKMIPNILNEERHSTFNNFYFNDVRVGLRVFDVSYIRHLIVCNSGISYIQVTFLGTGIIYAAEMGKNYGECIVYLDGKKIMTLSLTSDKPGRAQEVLNLVDLPYTYHTVRIQNKANNMINAKYFKTCRGDKHGGIIKQNTYLKYKGCDRETMGDWKKRYGNCGYVIPDMEWNYPVYGDIFIPKWNLYTNSEINSLRALLQYPNGDKRINKCYYCENQEIVNVIVTGDEKRKVSFYLLDWSKDQNITCQIAVRPLDETENIDVRLIDNMKDGVYITYEILGAFQFIIKYHCLSQEREYGDFYGVFFDW